MPSGLLFLKVKPSAEQFYNSMLTNSNATHPGTGLTTLSSQSPLLEQLVNISTSGNTPLNYGSDWYTDTNNNVDFPTGGGTLINQNTSGWVIHSSIKLTNTGNTENPDEYLISDVTRSTDTAIYTSTTTPVIEADTFYVLLPIDDNKGIVFFNIRSYANSYLAAAVNLAETFPITTTNNPAFSNAGNQNSDWYVNINNYNISNTGLSLSANHIGYIVIAKVSSIGGGNDIKVTPITDATLYQANFGTTYLGDGSSLYVFVSSLQADDMKAILLVKDSVTLGFIIDALNGVAADDQQVVQNNGAFSPPFNPVSNYARSILEADSNITNKYYFPPASAYEFTMLSIIQAYSPSTQLTNTKWVIVKEISSTSTNILDGPKFVRLTYTDVTSPTIYNSGDYLNAPSSRSLFIAMEYAPPPDDNKGMLLFPNIELLSGFASFAQSNLVSNMGALPRNLIAGTYGSDAAYRFLTNTYNIPPNEDSTYSSGTASTNIYILSSSRFKVFKVVSSTSVEDAYFSRTYTPSTVDSSDANLYQSGGTITNNVTSFYVLANITEPNALFLYLVDETKLVPALAAITGNSRDQSKSPSNNAKTNLSAVGLSLGADYEFHPYTQAEAPVQVPSVFSSLQWKNVRKISSTYDGTTRQISETTINNTVIYNGSSLFSTDITSLYIFVGEAGTIPTTEATGSSTSTTTAANPTTDSVGPPPCFLAGAMVHTDQGIKAIETIDAATHTIGGKRIVAITADRNPAARLVLLRKDLIAENVPDKDTLITVWHKVLYRENFIIAGKVPGLRSRPYKGEILYNVLMDTHETMIVNNMLCNTMPPDHDSAGLYRK